MIFERFLLIPISHKSKTIPEYRGALPFVEEIGLCPDRVRSIHLDLVTPPLSAQTKCSLLLHMLFT